MTYNIRYIHLANTKVKFKLGDTLIVSNPNFAMSDTAIIDDIFLLSKIKIPEYSFDINYVESKIIINFGLII